MKTAYGCKLFGAHQALAGIKDAVILFHSVVGCNYGTMLFHLSPCNQTDVRQTSTIINDSDIVFGGEASLLRALNNVRELYAPAAVFVVTGCVSDMIQDDVRSVSRDFERETGLRTIVVEAAGYRGGVSDGFEGALSCLFDEIRPPVGAKEAGAPVVNLIGPGADDRRVSDDAAAIEALLGGKARVGCCFADCTLEEVRASASADLNIVFGRGERFARRMRERFGVPFETLDFPYGYTGALALWDALSARFGLDFEEEKERYKAFIRTRLQSVYTFMETLYGIPVAVVGEGSRARGLARFLAQEIGMEAEVVAAREEIADMDDCFRRLRESEAAILFGSSFEQEIADEMGVPLVRFDYPVFDRFCLTNRPYAGPLGEICLIEDMFNEICHGKTVKGALYR